MSCFRWNNKPFIGLQALAAVLLFSSISFYPSASAQQPPAVSSALPESGAEPSTKTKIGIFYGHIIYIDPQMRSLTVRSRTKPYRTKQFYIDKYSQFFISNRKGRYRDLYFGDKVTVHYFSDDWLVVADKVSVDLGLIQESSAEEGEQKESLGQDGKAENISSEPSATEHPPK